MIVSVEDEDLWWYLQPFVHPSDNMPSSKAWKSLHAANYYGYYRQIAEQVQPTCILEIGVRYGYSALAMLLGCGLNCRVDYTGIDHEFFSGSNAYAESKIRTRTRGAVKVLKQTSQDLQQVPGTYHLVHLDASHRPDGLLIDLNLIGPAVVADGVIVIDDMKRHDTYATALRWAAARAFEVQTLDSMQGTLLIRKRKVRGKGRWPT